jgi:hypothetical protein
MQLLKGRSVLEMDFSPLQSIKIILPYRFVYSYEIYRIYRINWM